MSNNQELSKSDSLLSDLRYDDAGNAFSRDANGIWVPHRGFATPLPKPSCQLGGPVQAISGNPDTIHWPSGASAHFAERHTFGQQGTWGLTSATFSDPLTNSTMGDHGMTLPPASSNSRDLASIPLPQGHDEDLTTPHVIAEAQGYGRSPKIAGSRHPVKGKIEKEKGKPGKGKGKGKGKENSDDPEDLKPKNSKKRSRTLIDLDDDEEGSRIKRGRPHGANNYTVADTNKLLDIVEEELPLGQRGWTVVTTRYNKWATQLDRPVRKQSSLETKFKQLVKTTKPMGTGVCPDEVKRAHYIDELISERAGTRELADSDFDDAGGNNNPSESSDEDASHHPEARVAVAWSTRTQPDPPRRTRGAVATDLLTSLSHAFDPTVIRARDEDRTNRSLANTQILTLSQQLRDSQATNDKLCGQVFNLRNSLYEAQRAVDRAEMCLEMMRYNSGTRSSQRRTPPKFQEPKKRNQYYRWFPDGGEAVAWLSDDDPTNWEVEKDFQSGSMNADRTDSSKGKPESEDVLEL